MQETINPKAKTLTKGIAKKENILLNLIPNNPVFCQKTFYHANSNLFKNLMVVETH